jgi:hypothetical protein
MDRSKLKPSEQHFVKKVEDMNVNRAKDMKLLRGRNKLAGLFIAAGVFGIYFFTIFSVKQEKFLDFDTVPEKKS